MAEETEVNIEELAGRIERNESLSDAERRQAADLLRAQSKVVAGRKLGNQNSQKNRKFSSDKERYDYHNAQKREKKRKASEES